MFETPFVMVGNIVADPVHRRVGDQQVVKFRVASNSRRRTADGGWEAGHSLYVNVDCWDRLARGAAVLVKGDAVVVVGYVYTNEYTDGEGNRRSSTEVRATAIGPDLARSTVRIEQRKRSEEPAETVPAADGGAVAGDEPDDAAATEADEEALPLTA